MQPRRPRLRTNISPDKTAFIGRERDLVLVQKCLGRARLVTVLGAGGSGKTRLARRLGADVVGGFAGGVWFCDLSEAHTGDDLSARVAAALGIHPGAGSSAAARDDVLHALLAREEVLLVLDNFEQLVTDAAHVVGRWLEHAPQLRVLVTSRQALGLEGEVLCELPPLSRADGAALFEDSARAVRPAIEPSDVDRAAIDRIVEKLDGMPLAIKLAARLVDVLTPTQIDERLEQRFDLLRDDRRDTPARHATMRAAVAWSWDMLGPYERRSLAQCSVFRGGFTVEAAEAVVVLGPDAPATLEVIRALRQKSLLRFVEVDAQADQVRLSLYETVRDFAAEQLVTLDDCGAVEARHAAHYVARGEVCAAAQYTAAEAKCVAELGMESANLVAAHARSLARAPQLAARAALALHPFLRARGPAGRHLQILDAALDAVRSIGDARLTARLSIARGEAWRHFGDIAPALRDLDEALVLARAGAWRDVEGECLYQRATALWLDGRHIDASGDAKAALALFRQNGDRAREGLVLSLLGVVEQALGRFAEARQQHEAALEIHRALGHRRAEGLEYNRLAHLAYRTGRGRENRANLARALDALREAGDRISEALCTHNLGYQLLEEDEVAEAVGHIESALATYRELGVRRNEGAALAHLAAARLHEGDLGSAAALFEDALAIHASVGDRHTESFTLRHYARLSVERGEWDEADRLLARGLEAARASSNTQAEGFLLAYRAATCAMIGDVAEAVELLAAARRLGQRYRGLRLPDAIAIVEGCVDLARARLLEEQGADDEARLLRGRAAALARPVNEPSSVLRHTRRLLARALEAQSTERPGAPVGPATDLFSIRLSADGRKVTLAEQPTVDLARRRAQRSILHRLISHREVSPGDALPWSELFAAGWPGERVQVDAGFGRVRTTIWALRKLGLHAVLITRDDGYLLDPRVEIVREAS